MPQLTIERARTPARVLIWMSTADWSSVACTTVEVEVRNGDNDRMEWWQEDVVGLECDWLPRIAESAILGYLFGANANDAIEGARNTLQEAKRRIHNDPASRAAQSVYREAVKAARGRKFLPSPGHRGRRGKPTT